MYQLLDAFPVESRLKSGAGERRWDTVPGTDELTRRVSLDTDGAPRCNWRVMMLEPAVVECVIVDELVHVSVKSRSAEFRRMLSIMLPDAGRRRRPMEAGKALPIWRRRGQGVGLSGAGPY